LLDSSTIISGSVSKDLQKKGFFGGYTLLVHPLVAIETDNPGGKKELESLGDYAAMDRISLRRLDHSNDRSENHDQVIIQAAKKQDAILVTRDRGMYGNAVAQGVFCLTFKLEPIATKLNGKED
jgi:rRNA-processing protein FCF1